MLHAANREEDLHDDPDCCENDDDVHDKQQPVALLEERTNWMNAAHRDITVRKRSGIRIGHVGRRRCIRISNRMDRDRPAMSWFVVPNSGQMVMPPEPSVPWEKVRPKATSTAIHVARKVLILIPAVSPISCTTIR